MTALRDWARLIGIYKKELGFIGFFESISVKDKKVSVRSVAPVGADMTDDAKPPPAVELSE